MVSVFFSYSHKDEKLRDELEIHLSLLKRQGVISTWHDRRISGGKELDNEISSHLESDHIILLLVSPYFLASDYCYDNEMKRAMERHENGEARVIPVILHPCDWQGAPFGKLLAVPTDGKPISKFPNQHDAFLEVTKAIRKAVEEMGLQPSAVKSNHSSINTSYSKKIVLPDNRSSNLRIKKNFTDNEKDTYLNAAFEYIAKYFEGSLSELKARNEEIDFSFKRIDVNNFSSVIYVNGSIANSCRIWLGDRSSYPSGIMYSIGSSGGHDSYNASLSVDVDGYSIFLIPLGLSYGMDNQDEKMTYEGAAEYYWGMFIEPLQR